MTGQRPAGLPELPKTYRARNLLIWAIGFSLAIIGGSIFGWYSLDAHIRDRFNNFQILTLIVIGLVLIGFMMGLGMSVVVADEKGLKIRNAISIRRLHWDEIGEIQYRHGDPWAYAMLAGTEDDPVRRQMIGIQTTDKDRAHAAVAELRALHAHFRGR
ncbi:PH domain-containing protein [Granulicoccus sp. GXG6511]|uniref:PH domain-containing protein n=1 Tax=Granulicoccus sp. GXG6511 TaxID=3381351 RepID=UPI003D7F14E3